MFICMIKNLEKLKTHIKYVATNLYALKFCKIINNLFVFYENYSTINDIRLCCVDISFKYWIWFIKRYTK